MEIDILDGVASLLDKSLIRRVDQGSDEPRFLMLETIREYAAERLEENPEFSASARRSHAIYYAGFIRQQWKSLADYGREVVLEEIESELENAHIAWRYWVTEGDIEQLHNLTDGLWLLYDVRGWYQATVVITADLLNVLASTPSTPERAQQEIMLQTSLARMLLATKGYSPEVAEAYTRALELCEEYGEIPQLFPVLRALVSYYLYTADFAKGVAIGKQILSLAESRDDDNMRVEGQLVLGYCLAFLENLSLGMEHLEKGISYYDPDKQRSFRFRFGNNPGVTCFTTSALIHWMLGFPDRALKRADSAMTLASKLNHPFSMAYASFHTGLLHLWRREPDFAQERAKAVLDIAEKHEFLIWLAVGNCLHGAAIAGLDQAEEGLAQISQGIELYQELKTPPIFWPLLLFIRAGISGQMGRVEDGLRLIEEALGILGPDTDDALAPEIFRLKGELLLARSPQDATEAETSFQKAMLVAQKREARMMELRAAISMSRLWQAQGKTEAGRQLFSDTYEKMTEGFTTADLKEARALLTELT